MLQIVEAMPQTNDVGKFMETLGSFYEIVDEDSPIESQTALVPNHTGGGGSAGVTPDHSHSDTSSEHGIYIVVYISYRKFPKYLDTQNICCNHPKSCTRWRFLRVMHPKDAEGIANSVDPDQTAPLGAVWSGSALFAQTCLSENLGKLR